MQAPGGGTGVGVEVVGANGAASSAGQRCSSRSQRPGQAGRARPTPLLPAAEKPAEAPVQVNDIKPGENPAAGTPTPTQNGKTKKPKVDLSDESSSKKKKKKGLAKLNPF